MPRSPSIRTIATEAGYSTWTVSRALNRSAGVSSEVRGKILSIAESLGYRPNPLVSAVMSQNRASRDRLAFNGNLALVSAYREDRKPLPFHEEIVRAAHRRAADLGFKMDNFLVDHEGLSVSRLSKILAARNIHGVLDLPWNKPRDMSTINWQSVSAVRMVYSWGLPTLNLVTPDYYEHFLYALVQLRLMGYRRIGLYLYTLHDERILFKWRAAHLLFNVGMTGQRNAPVLVQETKDAKAFLRWVERGKLDLVVSYSHTPLEWLRENKWQVPGDCGFFSLNVHASKADCAGLDLNPERIGAIATETLAAQMHRNERGLPGAPVRISVPSRFHAGPTIRASGRSESEELHSVSEVMFHQCVQELRLHRSSVAGAAARDRHPQR
jgi:LacI family transcriptional regulator